MRTFTSSRRRATGAPLALLLVAAVAFSACSGDDKDPDKPRPGVTNNGADSGQVVDDAGDGTGGEADTGTAECDGEMSGTWLVRRESDDAEQVTLELCHAVGEDVVTGTYVLADGSTEPAPIDSASWRNDAFNAAWTARLGEVEESFQITNGIVVADGSLLAQFSDSRVAMAVDVSIQRVEEP